MSRRCVAFAVLVLAGTALSEPGFARGGGIRGGGGFRAPVIVHHPRGVLPVAPRAIARSAFTPRLGHRAHAIPPSPHGYATTNSLRPFGRLTRRHHGVYHQGWYLPTTIGDDTGYIGRPYDPAETIPVYGPAPAYDAPADPPRRPASARVLGPDDENACRAETVTVPAGDGERAIKVVRC